MFYPLFLLLTNYQFANSHSHSHSHGHSHGYIHDIHNNHITRSSIMITGAATYGILFSFKDNIYHIYYDHFTDYNITYNIIYYVNNMSGNSYEFYYNCIWYNISNTTYNFEKKFIINTTNIQYRENIANLSAEDFNIIKYTNNHYCIRDYTHTPIYINILVFIIFVVVICCCLTYFDYYAFKSRRYNSLY